MPAETRRLLPLVVALAGLSLAVAACGGGSGSPSPVASAPATSSAVPSASPVATPAPSPTPVPGGPGASPSPFEPSTSTTETDWGTILDSVPAGFPSYPGVRIAEPPDGPVSGAYLASAAAKDVADWYRQALEAAGYSSNDLSGPLEDGSWTIDTQGDLPECRIQTTFRPAGDETMITVLYGAGCATLGG